MKNIIAGLLLVLCLAASSPAAGPLFFDRVSETTATTGTGTVTLAGAQPGCRTFSLVGDGNSCFYLIRSALGAEWEAGIGTYTASGTTFSRDTVLSSSNSNNAVDFSAGTKSVTLTPPAAAYQYAVGTSGTDFSFAWSAGGVPTFHLPAASATASGKVTTSAQVFEGYKTLNLGAIINETSANSDTRIESDNRTHAIFVDASEDKIGLFSSSPELQFDLTGQAIVREFFPNNRINSMRLHNSGTTSGTAGSLGFSVGAEDGVSPAYISGPLDASTGVWLQFATGGGGTDYNANGTVRMTIDAVGKVGIGTQAPEGLLEVQAAEGADAVIVFDADEGDDDTDTWTLKSLASNNSLSFLNHTTEVASLSSAGNLQIDGTATISTLTSGRIPFASTGGLLTDSSLLTYSGGVFTSGYSANDPGPGGGQQVVFSNANAGASAQVRLGFERGADAGTGYARGMVLFAHANSGWADYEARKLSFYTGTAAGSATERVTIDTDGDVGIRITSPAVPLDIDTSSNTAGIRIRGVAEASEIADFYVDGNGTLILSTVASSDAFPMIDLRPKHGNYGLVLRECSGASTLSYANLYMTDTTIDYLNVVVDNGTSTKGLILDANRNLGLGQTSFGTSATRTFAISSGTAPGSAPADAAQARVGDFASIAGDARLFVYGEASVSNPVILGNGAVAATGALGVQTNNLANGQKINFDSLTELTTIAAAATTDTTIQIPAGAVVYGVSCRVTVAIPTATTFDVGVSGATTRYGTGISTAANATSAGTNDATRYYGSATAMRITPNATPASNAGRVRVTIHYYTITPATSDNRDLRARQFRQRTGEMPHYALAA